MLQRNRLIPAATVPAALLSVLPQPLRSPAAFSSRPESTSLVSAVWPLADASWPQRSLN